MDKTDKQYETALADCREIFIKKTRDYGTAWRVLRTSSLTDQIFIKAQRIRTLEEQGTSRVDESTEVEFVGIVNYAVMAIAQLRLSKNASLDLPIDEAEQIYERITAEIKLLMQAKNHDYGEAWRDMRISSLTDLILMKLLRIKQIEDNAGLTLISEGPESGYMDMVNYALFALIKMSEANQSNGL